MDNKENMVVSQQEMEVKVNEVYVKLSQAGHGESLIALLIGGVAFLKTIHQELLATGADVPEDLAQVVADLSSGLVANDAQQTV